MKYTNRFALLLLFPFLLFACQKENKQKTFTVKNPLELDRPSETISIPAEQLSSLLEKYGAENLRIREENGEQALILQPVDLDLDGQVDEILFQADMAAKAEKKFVVEGVEEAEGGQPESELTTYSRFVPERIDDYAWENDRVAFRTYGPEAQRITESGEAGGTLTSGMDAWLKRVNYPVIDKWYAAHQEEPGAYHIDSGEGYDPYHVGDSRGVGGLGVWDQDSLFVSKNFTAYKTIATGPIRTIFELSYAPWEANGRTIQETKRISLDLGSNLSRFELMLDSDKELPNVAIGLTLHEQQGKVKVKPEEGWFRYWEPIDGAELGVGLVIDPALVEDHLERRVQTKDQSHLLVLADPESKPLVYYSGFGWKKSGQFDSAEEWDQYLQDFAKRVNNPLEVNF